MGEGALRQLDADVDALAHTLGSIDLARHELAFLLRVRDRIDHLAAVQVGRLHVTGDARLDGASSTASWLRHHAAVSYADAQRLIRVGVALRSLPRLHEAVGAGVVSMAQDDQLVRGIGPRLAAFAVDEAVVVDAVIGLSAKDTGTVAVQWAALHDALHHPAADPVPARVPPPVVDDDPFPDPEPAAAHEPGCSCRVPTPADPSSVFLSQLLDRFVLDGDLTPADGETLRLACDLFAPTDGMLTPAQRRAVGLVAACRFALDHRTTPRSPRHRPHLLIHTGPDLAVGTTPDGTVISPADLARAACDAVLSRLVQDRDGHVLAYGRRTRVIPAPLREVVVARDRHCRFPGCDRNAAGCDVHHAVAWSNGGPTDLTNLVLVCGWHHAVLHSTGWHHTLHPDGRLHVTTPGGLHTTSRPPPR